MGIRRENFERSSAYRQMAVHAHFMLPTNTFDNDTAVLDQYDDLSATTAPETRQLQKGLIWPQTLYIGLTDAASADLVISATFHGLDHFGREVSESITGMTAAGGPYVSTEVYSFLDYWVIDAITAGAAGDKIGVGLTGPLNTGLSPKYALPAGVTDSSQVVAIYNGITNEQLAVSTVDADAGVWYGDGTWPGNTIGHYVVVYHPKTQNL